MRVRFPRLPDHERAYALVERDDGAVYRLYGGPAGPRLPHDIMHFVVERELHIGDGIWGGIAAGIIFDTMQHVSGRRSPHARERSTELLASFRQRGLRAEVLANFVECVACADHPSDFQIMTLAATKLTVLPNAGADLARPRSPPPRRPCRSRRPAGPGSGSGKSSATTGPSKRAPRSTEGPGRVSHVSFGRIKRERGTGRHHRTARRPPLPRPGHLAPAPGGRPGRRVPGR